MKQEKHKKKSKGRASVKARAKNPKKVAKARPRLRSVQNPPEEILVRERMTDNVETASPDMSIQEAAQMMRKGEFGCLPVGENDRLVGMITDRDITTRAVAESKDPQQTKVREVMTEKMYYCFDDQPLEEIAKNMADIQVRRLPVVNREKRLVGILSLCDLAQHKDSGPQAEEALEGISRSSQVKSIHKATA